MSNKYLMHKNIALISVAKFLPMIYKTHLLLKVKNDLVQGLNLVDLKSCKHLIIR